MMNNKLFYVFVFALLLAVPFVSADSEPLLNTFTRVIMSLVVGFIGLGIMSFGIVGIGIYLKNNYSDLNNKEILNWMILMLLVVLLGTVIMVYASQVWGTTQDTVTGDLELPPSPWDH